jgi:hypothetical protein
MPGPAAHGDGGSFPVRPGSLRRLVRPASAGAPQAGSPQPAVGELTGGGPASTLLPPLVSAVVSMQEAEAVSTSPMLSSASMEVPCPRMSCVIHLQHLR